MGLDLSLVSRSFGPFEHAYTWRDVALYALSLGAGPADLAYLLEPAPKVLPTFAVTAAFEPVVEALRATGGDLLRLLHTAQKTEQLSPFPPVGVVRTTATVQGIYDMRIGALVQVETASQVDDVLCARTTWSLLLSGQGGFASERAPLGLRTRPPKGETPSFVEPWTTSNAQALLYRLNGDLNPIHAREDAAQKAGLAGPILHGLCSYGFLGRVALKQLAGDDPARFRSFEARFSKPVIPGQTLVAEGFVMAPGQAALTLRVRETEEIVIGNALFTYEV